MYFLKQIISFAKQFLTGNFVMYTCYFKQFYHQTSLLQKDLMRSRVKWLILIWQVLFAVVVASVVSLQATGPKTTCGWPIGSLSFSNVKLQ